MLLRLTSFSLLFLFYSLFSIDVAHAQEITSQQIQDMAATTAVPDKRTTETQGSPFFNPEFAQGSITFKNEQTTNVLPLRYDAYRGTLQFRRNNNIFEIDSSVIKEFELYASDGLIKFEKGYEARRLDPDDFVAVMTEGEARFMVHFSKNYRENVSGYGQATQVEEYADSESFYVKFGDGDVERIRSLSERRVMRVFPSHTDELEQYARENNLSFENMRDVTRLFKHYNALQEQQSS